MLFNQNILLAVWQSANSSQHQKRSSGSLDLLSDTCLFGMSSVPSIHPNNPVKYFNLQLRLQMAYSTIKRPLCGSRNALSAATSVCSRHQAEHLHSTPERSHSETQQMTDPSLLNLWQQLLRVTDASARREQRSQKAFSSCACVGACSGAVADE